MASDTRPSNVVQVAIEDFIPWLESRLMEKCCCTTTLNDALCCLSSMLTNLQAIRCAACELAIRETASDKRADTPIRQCVDSMICKVDQFCETVRCYLDQRTVGWVLVGGTELHALLSMYHHALCQLKNVNEGLCAQVSLHLDRFSEHLRRFDVRVSSCPTVISYLTQTKQQVEPMIQGVLDDLASFRQVVKGSHGDQSTALGDDNYGAHITAVQARLAKAADSLDTYTEPFVSMCKEIHRANKKVPVDAIAPNFSAENIELLERFSPLLVQADIPRELLGMEDSAVEGFWDAMAVMQQICKQENTNLGLQSKITKAVEEVDLEACRKGFRSEFGSWRQSKAELKQLSKSPKGFYHRTLALGQDLQLKVSQLCREELKLEVVLDLGSGAPEEPSS